MNASDLNVDRQTTVPTTDDRAPAPVDDDLAPTLHGSPQDGLEARIRDLAYDLYCSRGHTDGDAVTDWLEAERQLRSSQAPAEADRSTELGASSAPPA